MVLLFLSDFWVLVYLGRWLLDQREVLSILLIDQFIEIREVLFLFRSCFFEGLPDGFFFESFVVRLGL